MISSLRMIYVYVASLGLIFVSSLFASSAFAGWSVNGTQVMDPTGKEFIFRGVNHAHNWYPDKTPQALTSIAATGANAVRIVLSNGTQWARNNGADVAGVITQCKAAKLVCVLEVHDSTGFGDSVAATNISDAAKYWISSDIKNAVIGQEDYVIINIANEPYGNGVNAVTYTTETSAAIKSIRNAGLTHLLMVDAPNWGQDGSHIMRDNAAKVFAADSLSNTLFSVHMYDNYNNAATVQDYLTSFKALGFALVVGEFGSENNGKPVDVASILKYTQQLGIGYFGWSWSGNGDCCAALDIANNWNASSLSVWGNQLINGANGISASSKIANIFSQNSNSPITALAALPAPTQTDINTFYRRVSAEIFSQKFDKNYVNSLLTQVDLKTGKFPGIDYLPHQRGLDDKRTTDYAPYAHIQKTKQMALAYATDATYKNVDVLAKIKKAMSVNLQYSHVDYFEWKFDFYYIFIRSPEDYAQSLFLLKSALTTAEFNAYVAQLRDGLQFKGLVDATGNGANRTWIARDTVLQGLLLNDVKLINEGLAVIAERAAIVSSDDHRTGQGIKADYQWHEHEGQLYSGGYGGAIFDIVKYMEFTKDTNFFAIHFPQAKIDLLSNTLLQGYQWLIYKHFWDFGTIGRLISASSAATPINSTDFSRMAKFVPAKQQDYSRWATHINGGVSNVTGNRYFWKSNIAVQRGDNYYLSAKIPSKRWCITESFDNLNFNGFTLGLGATNIHTSGDEYKAIFPLWDWSRVPGTTAQSNFIIPFPTYYPYGTNTFAGGLSSGSDGITAFNGTFNGVSANKAYFFIGDALYAMGSGITANKSTAIVTSINQTLTSGAISFGKADGIHSYDSGTTPYTDLIWAHQDNVGYLFPKGGKITLENKLKTGKWWDINHKYTDQASKTDFQKNVFSLWFDHGAAPANATYEYAVVPDKTSAEFTQYVANNPFVTVINNTQVQALRHTTKGIDAIVFYQAGTVDLKDGLIISADKAAMVMIEKNSVGYNIIVSDPLYVANNSIKITINKQLKNISYDSVAKNSDIIFALPMGDYVGNSVARQFTLVSVGNSSSNRSSSSLRSSNPASLHSSSNTSLSKTSSSKISLKSSQASSIASSIRSSAASSTPSSTKSSLAKTSSSKPSSSSGISSSVAANPLSCTYAAPNSWDTGFIGVIRITNMGNKTISGWTATWTYLGNNRITSSWNGILKGINPYSASATADSAFSWNSSLAPGQTVEFGFQGNRNADKVEIPSVNCR